ncbi:electron transfer flavoprotein beta subunit/FixA family protein [Arcanobacterium hippocoleae]|uniref:Electron transfer flavoprotein beta subunit n=1 Tax=Arcanobacterium hippocoleae TaxID=149017 RepID=A0ABU1T455_9ACTO|nr:electron transfer flavoprotein beta subunit/FixA family protein [Arcanobacterium hippocoleae]MDR6939646.1 electron transfer flavoprotein beta subunit [Arcanobacterium hippocoleae]
MKIVVLYKWAPDPQNASANADGVIDWGAKRTISEYDPVAIHAARIFADSLPESTELIGITAGEASAASPKATQAAASRGLDSLLVIADDALKGATADVYARVLSAAIKKIGGANFIIAGDASADAGGQAVPGLVAGHLGIPSFADVNQIVAGANTGEIQIHRHTASTAQILRLHHPAVISVTTDAASIPLIGMKDMMAARKKPVEKLTLADLDLVHDVTQAQAATTLIATAKPEVKPRKKIIFDSEQAAAELVAALREEGVLS